MSEGGKDHPGCRYYAVLIDGVWWFCNKCGWGASALPDEETT